MLLCSAFFSAGSISAQDTQTLWQGDHTFPSGWNCVYFQKTESVEISAGGTVTANFSTNGGNFGIGVSTDGSSLKNADKIGFPDEDGYNADYGFNAFSGNKLTMTLTESEAAKLNNAAYLVLNGENCTITSLTYTPKAPTRDALLWEGEADLGGWNKTFYFRHDFKFEIGDKLILNYTSSDDAQIQLNYGNSQTMSHGSLQNPADNGYTSVDGDQYIVEITADNINAYNSRYLAFKGKNTTIKSFVIIPAEKNEATDYKFTEVSESDIPEGASNVLYDRMTRFGVGEGQVYLARHYAFKEGDKITINIGAYNNGSATAENPQSELCLAVTTIKALNDGGSAIVNGLTKTYADGQSDAAVNGSKLTFTIPSELTGELQTGEDKKILVLIGQNLTISDIVLEGADVVEPEQRFQREVPSFIQNLTLYRNEEGWPSYSWGFSSFGASQAYTDWYNAQNPAPTHEEIQAKLVEERKNWPWATDTNPDNYYLSLPPFASKIGDKIYIELERNTTNANYDGSEGGMQIQFWTPKQNEDGSWTDEIFVFSNGNNYMDLTGSGYEIVINQRWLDAFQANGFRIKGRQFVIKKVEWRHNTELDEEDNADYIYHIKAEQFGADGIARLSKGLVPFFYVFFQDGRLEGETAEAPEGTFSYYGPYDSEGSTDFVAQWLYEGEGQALGESNLASLPLVESAWETAVHSGYISEGGPETARVAAYVAENGGQDLPEEEIALYDGTGGINSSFMKYKYTVNVPAETGTVNGKIYMHKVVTAKTDPNGNFYSMGGSVESLNNGLSGYLFDPNTPLVQGLEHDGIYMSVPGNSKGLIGVYVPQQSDFEINTESGVITGVEDVVVGENPDELTVEVYTLDGLKADRMIPGRIYIVRRGDKIQKVLAK